MPKFLNNVLDILFPKRIEFREEEARRKEARKARKQELCETKERKYKIWERIDRESKQADTIEIQFSEEQLHLEKHWVEKAMLFTSYQLVNNIIQGIDGYPRMYEVEIVSPRKMKDFKTHVYAYVECRGSQTGATVFLYVPAIFGQEEQFKAMAFYNAIDHVWLKESETIEIAWRIFAPLLEDMAA